MKVTVKIPASKPVESFLDYLKVRAIAPEHEANGDLIADFVDKFLVVELRRLENENDYINQDIEIPDSAVMSPLMSAKKAFDEYFDKFVSARGGVPSPVIQEETLTPHYEPHESELKTDAFAMDPSVREFLGNDPVAPDSDPFGGIAKRSGNGHKILKKRALYAFEKNSIRAEFLAINGQIADDACKPIHAKMDKDVSIFQVTGFITYLHAQVAGGNLRLDNLDAYIQFLQSHRKLWATYDSPKYRAMRAKLHV